MRSIIEITGAILEIFIVLFFFKQTLPPKEQSKSIKYVIIIGVSIIHIVRSFMPIPTYINFSITFVLWGIFLIGLFDGSLIRKAVIISIYFVVFIVCDMVTRYITASILNVTYNTLGTTGLQRYIGMVIDILLNFVVIYSISLLISRKQTTLSFKYWVMLLLFPVFSLFIIVSTDILMVLANVNDIKYILLLLIIILGLLYFNTVVFEFIDSYSSKLQLESARELLRQQEENYRLLESNEETMRFLRHNISNHMEIMKNMIKNNNIAEPMEFLKSLENLSSLPMGSIYTNDITLDSILNVECKKATASNIKYIVKVNNITEQLNIQPADKSTILCNAIDNAIEACAKTDDRFIIIDISSDKRYIKICIENSSLPIEVKNNFITTTKLDIKNHGLGLKSILQTIKKYNGHLDISYNDGITTLIILMDNQKIHVEK